MKRKLHGIECKGLRGVIPLGSQLLTKDKLKQATSVGQPRKKGATTVSLHQTHSKQSFSDSIKPILHVDCD